MNSPIRIPTEGLSEVSPQGLHSARAIPDSAINKSAINKNAINKSSLNTGNVTRSIQPVSLVEQGLRVHEEDRSLEEEQAKNGSPGEWLRKTRDYLGRSVDDVASELKLPPDYVRALEWDEWSKLPSGPFAKGYLRNYALLLGLKPEPMLDIYYAKTGGAQGGRCELPRSSSASHGQQGSWWKDVHVQKLGVALVVMLLALALVVFWPFGSLGERQDVELQNDSMQPMTKTHRSMVPHPMDRMPREKELQSAPDGATNDIQIKQESINNTFVQVDSVFGDRITVEASEDGRVIYHVATELLEQPGAVENE